VRDAAARSWLAGGLGQGHERERWPLSRARALCSRSMRASGTCARPFPLWQLCRNTDCERSEVSGDCRARDCR